MLNYHLGEMRSENGVALKFEVESRAAEHALRIFESVKNSRAYTSLMEKLHSKRTSLYMHHALKREVHPFVLKACVIEWYRRNDKAIPAGEDTIILPKKGIYVELKKCWSFEGVDIVLVNKFVYYLKNRAFLAKEIKSLFKRARFEKLARKRISQDKKRPYTIAIHFCEGIDGARRNDFNWYNGEKIDPSRILVYFDGYSSPLPNATKKIKNRRVFTRETTEELERRGFKWVSLKKGTTEDSGHFWEPGRRPAHMILKLRCNGDSLEKWMKRMANELMGKVYFWSSFFDDFNVAINYAAEEGSPENIAQAIAFDIRKDRVQGLCVGKQRSLYFSFHTSKLGCHPKHIIFAWSRLIPETIPGNHDLVERFPVTGFPYDTKLPEQSRERTVVDGLREKGAKFIVSIFDNVCDSIHGHARTDVENFYRSFLKWVVEDAEIGLIAKPKKNRILKKLCLEDVAKKALGTGRYVRIADEVGRHPFEVSRDADMTVGIGISAAVAEVAIHGGRAVHYNSCRFDDHEYKNMKNMDNLIFETLSALMGALKECKMDSLRDSPLGDWSSRIGLLDEYNDGKGGTRMGEYIALLLRGFDLFDKRNDIIGYAETAYNNKWGKNKVNDERRNYETV